MSSFVRSVRLKSHHFHQHWMHAERQAFLKGQRPQITKQPKLHRRLSKNARRSRLANQMHFDVSQFTARVLMTCVNKHGWDGTMSIIMGKPITGFAKRNGINE